METGFIVMQESHSRAHINSYVKWPFIFDNLLGMEVMVGALCGNDIVKRKGEDMSVNMLLLCCSCLFLSSSEHNTSALAKTPSFSSNRCVFL